MHSGLSKVECMVTPADLRRMLARASDNHAQNTPDIRVTPLDIARMKSKIQPQQSEEDESIFVD
ncbi:DNA mismatch repair protein MutT, partial [Gardnerella vaginalis]